MSLLTFTYQIPLGAKAGRELLADLNAVALAEAAGGRAIRFAVDASARPAGVVGRLRAVLGWLDGLTPGSARECLAAVRSSDVDVVYIEGSNYGRLARLLRRQVPGCHVVTFFHNVEARFFWGAFRARPSIKAAAVLLANWLAEGWAVKHSHRLICLNQRDSDLLKLVYGRGATDIHPMCIVRAQPEPGAGPESGQEQKEQFGLFVGGAFYANVSGVRWFAQHVAPMLPCPVHVVGKGFEQYRDEFANCANLRIVGTVDALDDWYERCSFVVAPIFDGSGMKTKVAEALMYGKPVIGTSEAFVGYDEVAHRAGRICDDPGAFVEAVQDVVSGRCAFDAAALRSLYAEHYSYDAKKRRFRELLSSLGSERP